MRKAYRSIFIGAAVALLLASCHGRDGLPTTSNTGASSVPAAAPTFAAKDAADKNAAMQDPYTLQSKALAPQEEMTKSQESKSMPLPGQANDHSTTARDKDKGTGR